MQGGVLIDKNGNAIGKNARGNVIPSGKEGQTPLYLEYNTHLTDNENHIDRILNLLSIYSGISPTAFGIDAGRGESGASREQLMYTSQTRIRRHRRGKEIIARQALAVRTGIPIEDITVRWITDPMETVTQRNERLDKDYELGNITLKEWRIGKGYAVDDDTMAMLESAQEQATQDDGQDQLRQSDQIQQ